MLRMGTQITEPPLRLFSPGLLDIGLVPGFETVEKPLGKLGSTSLGELKRGGLYILERHR